MRARQVLKRRKKRTKRDEPEPTFEIVENPNAPSMYIGYARVSTVEQSLEMQVDALKRAGVTTAGLYIEKVSAVSKHRPMLEDALGALRPGDTFVVWKLDRLSRSLPDLLRRLEQIEKKKAGFKSLTDSFDTTSPSGRLVLYILGVVADFERSLISERTKAGVARAKAEGKQVGQPPALKPHEIVAAQKMRNAGKSVRAIAKRYKVSHGTIYNHTDGPKRSRRKS